MQSCSEAEAAGGFAPEAPPQRLFPGAARTDVQVHVVEAQAQPLRTGNSLMSRFAISESDEFAGSPHHSHPCHPAQRHYHVPPPCARTSGMAGSKESSCCGQCFSDAQASCPRMSATFFCDDQGAGRRILFQGTNARKILNSSRLFAGPETHGRCLGAHRTCPSRTQ